MTATDPDPNVPAQQQGLKKLDHIRRSLRVLVVATLVLTMAVAALAGKTYSDAQTAQDALCALRVDLEKRVESSKNLLIEHPEGIPGIEPRVFKDSIKNQERTIAALSGLSC